MGEDDWVEAAMADDSMVAELLLRIRHSGAQAPALEPPLVRRSATELPPLEWGAKQPRSRPVPRCNVLQSKKEREPTRGSPTTPLSWSAGTSGSGGAEDCYEESSRTVRRPVSDRSDSKVTAACESSIRRSRKKSLAELKEDEGLLLKERMHLKKEMATLKINYNDERARNEILNRFKRMKLGSTSKAGTTSTTSKETCNEQPCPTEARPICHVAISPPVSSKSSELAATVCPSSLRSISCEPEKKRKDATVQSSFVLPDLNVPLEVDSDSETLYGMS